MGWRASPIACSFASRPMHPWLVCGRSIRWPCSVSISTISNRWTMRSDTHSAIVCLSWRVSDSQHASGNMTMWPGLVETNSRSSWIPTRRRTRRQRSRPELSIQSARSMKSMVNRPWSVFRSVSRWRRPMERTPIIWWRRPIWRFIARKKTVAIYIVSSSRRWMRGCRSGAPWSWLCAMRWQPEDWSSIISHWSGWIATRSRNSKRCCDGTILYAVRSRPVCSSRSLKKLAS